MERRQLLQSFALGSLVAARPALAAEAARITVTDLEIFTVKVNHRGNWLLIRLHTSAGVRGIGEASHGNDELVVKLLRQFFDRLKGRGIFEIEMVGAHVCATLPNFHILEFSYGEVPWRAEVIDPPESVLKGGYLALTGRPGYGIELNDPVLAAHKV